MNMYAFYVARGQSLDYLINLDYYEKIFYHHARQIYYEEEKQKYKNIFGE